MSRLEQWVAVSGVVLTIIGTGVALAALLTSQIGELRTHIRRLDDRVRAVEVAIASYHAPGSAVAGATEPGE